MNMGMGFNMEMRPVQKMIEEARMIVRCQVCKSDPHAEGCPVKKLEKFCELQRHIKCPVCLFREVGINSGDFYECRYCHTQFAVVGTHNIFYLDDPQKMPHMFEVLILPQKGKGDFPLDKNIAELQSEIEKLTTKKRKRKK